MNHSESIYAGALKQLAVRASVFSVMLWICIAVAVIAGIATPGLLTLVAAIGVLVSIWLCDKAESSRAASNLAAGVAIAMACGFAAWAITSAPGPLHFALPVPRPRALAFTLLGLSLLLFLYYLLLSREAQAWGELRLLDWEREALFRKMALEIETNASILGVSLNDALEEFSSGNAEIARRLLTLSVVEFEKLEGIELNLLGAMSGWADTMGGRGLFVRALDPRRFKSRALVESLGIVSLRHYRLTPWRLRFHSIIRALKAAVELLGKEVHKEYQSLDQRVLEPENLDQLEFLFHDFDLVSKEVLLALRALLKQVPTAVLGTVSVHLSRVIHGARHPLVSKERILTY